MAQGLAVALPLTVDTVDGPYTLHKNLTDMASQNLKMVILTSPGERVMIPEFGVGIRSFLFEPNNNDTRERIRNRIQVQVEKYLPYIELVSLELYKPQSSMVGETDDNGLVIRIKYSIPAANVVSELTIDAGSGASTSTGGGSGGSGGGY
jgi:phage baseplate assembly protein W